MHVPHLLLTPDSLQAIVEEFVTRDGTDLSDVEQRSEQVLHQLDVGTAELHFEQETGTCNIQFTGDGQNSPADNGNVE